MKIIFINEKGFNNPLPIAAKKHLPEWYKQTDTYVNNKKINAFINGSYITAATIKKCMPVFDVMGAGYLISAWADIKIKHEEGVATFEIDQPILTEHNPKQAPTHPDLDSKADLIPKFINTWGIKTPSGYSCLFIPPAHRRNVIEILPAVVDTDTYNLSIHFPFRVIDKTFSGSIPIGTPLVQIIPFARESWELEIEDANAEDYTQAFNKLHEQGFNGYKDHFWSSKDYT